MRGLVSYSERNALAVTQQTARANSDGRPNERYRKSNLFFFGGKEQIHATYGWTRPERQIG